MRQLFVCFFLKKIKAESNNPDTKALFSYPGKCVTSLTCLIPLGKSFKTSYLIFGGNVLRTYKNV